VPQKTRLARKRKVPAVPRGFRTLTPYLVVRDAARAIEFYKQAFGAKVRGVHSTPDGKVMNADLQIGDSILLLNDEFPGAKCTSPQALGGTTATVHIYVKDVDALFSRAVAAGAMVLMPLADQFWGDRYGQLLDPFGHCWSLATHKENLSPQEIEKRGQAIFAEMAKKTPPAG
jgi:PhnB protein